MKVMFYVFLLIMLTFQNNGSFPYIKAAFRVFGLSSRVLFSFDRRGTAKPRNELSGLCAVTKQ